MLCFSDLEGFLYEFADIGKEDSPSIEELFSVCCVSVIWRVFCMSLLTSARRTVLVLKSYFPCVVFQ